MTSLVGCPESENTPEWMVSLWHVATGYMAAKILYSRYFSRHEIFQWLASVHEKYGLQFGYKWMGVPDALSNPQTLNHKLFGKTDPQKFRLCCTFYGVHNTIYWVPSTWSLRMWRRNHLLQMCYPHSLPSIMLKLCSIWLTYYFVCATVSHVVTYIWSIMCSCVYQFVSCPVLLGLPVFPHSTL